MIITVQCPACETTFPVDPRKVPDGGVKVRCSSCSGIFFVAKPEVPSVADLAPSPEAQPAAAAAPVEAPAAVETPAAPTSEPEPAQSHRDDAFEDAFGEVDGWDGADFDDPSDGVHHDHGSPDPWAGGMDLPDPDDSPDAPGMAMDDSPDAPGMAMDDSPEAPALEMDDSPESPVVDRLETVEDVTRAAAAEFPSPEPLDDPDDAWGEAAPAAEAPVGSFDDEAPESSSHAVESGGNVEVAAPPVEAPAPPAEAPAPSKFQFGRRDPDDKARRLARVLVSDIITYNPERHQRALEQDTLHADFEDEIRKSWAEYVEQVGRELAESTSYWFDALNEILARGRKVF